MEWIMKNRRFLNLSEIEKEVGIPKPLLSRHIKGGQKLGSKWHKPLEEFVKQLKKS